MAGFEVSAEVADGIEFGILQGYESVLLFGLGARTSLTAASP